MQERAIQVIKYTQETQKFEIPKEAQEFFNSLDGDIGFVVVCGRYRTGKSFMLNKLLDISGSGFKVDAATDSCTQGIWMYSKPIVNPKNNLKIFFLDTEGSESIERSQNHDAKIFALAILMCSIFIFNSRGSIDETSISQLQLTTTLAKNIQVQGEDESKLKYFTPKFVWVLRDYVLEMRDKNQNELTPKQYMENALTDESAYVKSNESNKKVRQSLLNFFKERQCYTLVTPADDKQLSNIDSLPFNKLRPEFQTNLIKIKEYILNNCQAKQLNSENVNGRMFCSMLDNFITTINRGGVPNIETAWDNIIQNECQKGFDQAKKYYQNSYTINFVQNKNNRKLEETFQVLAKMRDECFEQFHQVAGVREMNKFYDQYKKQLQDLMNKLEEEIIYQNESSNDAQNQEIIAKQVIKLQEDVNQQNYTYDDLHFFTSDFISFISNYDKQSSGCGKAQTIFEYLQNSNLGILKKLDIAFKTSQGNQKIKGTSNNINNNEINKAIQDYNQQFSLLEQTTQQLDTQIAKLDQEKSKLDQEKKRLKEELEKLQNRQSNVNDNQNNIQQNQEMQKIQEDTKKILGEIEMIKKQTEALKNKKKKGCCG